MNIGDELQMAVQRSAKLSTLISGLFESDKPTATEDPAQTLDDPDNGLNTPDLCTNNRSHAARLDAEYSVALDTVKRNDRKQADEKSRVDVSEESDEPRAGDEGVGDEGIGEESLSAEAVLIESAKEDPAAFGLLYERYVDRVYAYIYHRVGNTQEAEDLTARTFYRALSRLHTYEDRGYPFSAWLFRIAHNLVANWHRDRSRRRFLSLDRIWSHSHDGDTPERAVEQAERSNALWDAINRLPNDRRELIFYKFGSRLSNVEIGELMNKSESAIKSLYFRTLAALRSDLEKDDL